MPYASEAQSAYIHLKAKEGVPWAVKFVHDSEGTKVPHIQHVKPKPKKKVKRKHG